MRCSMSKRQRGCFRTKSCPLSTLTLTVPSTFGLNSIFRKSTRSHLKEGRLRQRSAPSTEAIPAHSQKKIMRRPILLFIILPSMTIILEHSEAESTEYRLFLNKYKIQQNTSFN